tara:strand:+ start:175 stop:336 length:162 start_codon:yes stop_codon:yes gene_type:complete
MNDERKVREQHPNFEKAREKLRASYKRIEEERQNNSIIFIIDPKPKKILIRKK